ncbi:MFS transporter [Halostella sp. JP-L12]|uniref:MFS transporter n=1 Tax=Halostella TaxID=1843185 RepID=UPI000EF7DA40|nr:MULTISPECIES: MFS transporter [Halostella]NHN48051.1 MFS transporter [Halostella sp. JP-L12]
MRSNTVRAVFSRWSDRFTVLSLCVGSYFAVRFTQVLIGPVVPEITRTFDVSKGAIGVALTGMWVAYALFQLPSGVFADRFGERRLMLVALGTITCATLGLATAPTFQLFGLGVLALGIGAGIYYNPATALLAREFDEVGWAVGMHRTGGQVAGIAAPVAATVITVRYGWRAAIAVGFLLTVVAVILFAWQSTVGTPARPTASLSELFEPSNLLALLIRPHTRYTTLIATLVEFVGLASMAFLPTLFIEHSGFSSRRANLLFALFYATTALFQPLGGWLSGRIGRDETIAFQAIAGVLGYGVLVIGDRLIVAVPAVVLAGSAISSMPVIQSRMMDELSAADQGRGFGLFRTLYLLVGALGTTVMGSTVDVAGWETATGLLAALLAVVVLSLMPKIIDYDCR